MTSRSESPPPTAKPLSLHRWSQRKHEVARAEAKPDAVKRDDATPAASGATESLPTSATVGAMSTTAAPGAPTVSTELPPVESLTPASDFTAFFAAKTGVGETVKRAALKQLLRDPRFNVMDGLDTYIDDYTREDPIPESVLKRLVQARAFRDPNPEEQAEEQAQRDTAIASEAQAQRDAAIAQADGGTEDELPQAPGAPPELPPPKKP